MKALPRFILLLTLAVGAGRAQSQDFVENFDTIYNSLTVERRGQIVELRARARGSEALSRAFCNFRSRLKFCRT